MIAMLIIIYSELHCIFGTNVCLATVAPVGLCHDSGNDIAYEYDTGIEQNDLHKPVTSLCDQYPYGDSPQRYHYIFAESEDLHAGRPSGKVGHRIAEVCDEKA